MIQSKSYIFTSQRLGFREWASDDIQPMIHINTDADVMAFFPSIGTPSATRIFIHKMQEQWEQNKHCYFAVDRLDDGQFIGFIGLSTQTFPSAFTPFVDIGWRLGKEFWGQGYAQEGARRCLRYGFETLGFKEICAVAPLINTKSIHVMQKIGMAEKLTFDHPYLVEYPKLVSCTLYLISYSTHIVLADGHSPEDLDI